MAKRYWLLKSEPEAFSIDDLARARDKTAFWDGVRNYQARNLLRDELKPGDGVLFYHSSADPPAVAGTATVTRAGYPDPTQFDARSDHHDPDSPREDPRWFGVDIRWESTFARPIPLEELRRTPGLEDMVLLQRSRLSVQPVTPQQWSIIVKLATARPKTQQAPAARR
jgi:predicted RNA-binding protein with PUA-like domain